MHRRQFLKTSTNAAVGGLAAAVGPGALVKTLLAVPETVRPPLPRWRGFNLVEKLSHTPDEWATAGPEWGRNNDPFRESDFQWIAELGFNFVRLPMSYLCWTDPKDRTKFLEKPLAEIDQAVAWGRQYGVHVDLCFCRAPGYYICSFAEKPTTLWKYPKALDYCAFQWRHFARRYKGIPSSQLSFNLVNEPANVLESDYVRVVTRLVKDIREEDPGRLIVADGREGGVRPTNGLVDLDIVQSLHFYEPHDVTHYHATWAGYPKTHKMVPSWPLRKGETIACDKDKLRRVVKPWKELAAKGGAVHVGECGCYRFTPHEVALAWMGDMLSLVNEAGWGWALWNFRGSFGIVDSQRPDVKYENFKGHQLDRKMLELLRQS
jgi:endoglucanase